MQEKTSDIQPEPTVHNQETDPACTPSVNQPEAAEGKPETEWKIGFRGKKTKVKKKGKNGAPKGNKNAMKHGFSSGGLPSGCSYIVRQTATFRKAMEAAIIDVRGQIGVYEIACVQTATEYHQHALKVRRWARVADDELSHDQRIAYSREVARAFESRDRILKNLGLDTKAACDETLIDALYSRAPAITDQRAESDQTDSDDLPNDGIIIPSET